MTADAADTREVSAANAPWRVEGFSAALTALLRNEQFQRFMQEAPYAYEPQQAPDLPAGVDADLAQELVVFARRMRGMPLLSAGDDAAQAFWVVSPAMQRDLFKLVARCEASSGLWSTLRPLLDRRAIKRFVARDLEAASVRDGIAIDRDAVYAVACGERCPRTDEERLVARTLELLERPSAELNGSDDLQALQASLAAGFEAVPSHPRYRMPVSQMLNGAAWTPPTVQNVWNRIQNIDQYEVHPLIGILFVSDIMFDAGPFSQFNALMEIVLRHSLAHRLSLPVLRCIPLSALRLDWEEGRYPQRHDRPYGKALTPGRFGSDSTLMLRESIGFLKQGLSELEQAAASVLEADARLCERVEADWRLNHRQKELLCDLARHPERTVDARGYEERCDVAMSTAHTDLASLARLDLLRACTVGKKQVYQLNEAAYQE